MAKNILKEAIADAKAVREVALANAKAALEEAFTPRLQSMLSAKLSEELDTEEDKEEIEENFMEEETNESYMEGEKEELDEEIDLEEILNELELDEGDDSKEETVDEAKAEDDEEIEEAVGKPNHRAEYTQDVMHKADDIHAGLNEGGSFDLDALLEEINNLDETEEEEEVKEYVEPRGQTNTSVSDRMKATLPGGEDAVDSFEAWMAAQNGYEPNDAWQRIAKGKFNEGVYEAIQSELEETKSALEIKTTELNEVNLLNSKLLYVNRIFKANNLNEAQKLRVVETLDNASNVKEAKLIYETIKDTFTISKEKKTAPKKSIRENFGMASKAAGTSTAPKKPILNESNDMVTRMQKLANITIKQ
jgi:hypothetical protein